jgi:hypothetical protein
VGVHHHQHQSPVNRAQLFLQNHDLPQVCSRFFVGSGKILKIFSEKLQIIGKILLYLVCGKNIISLDFKKNANFCRK